MDNLEYEIYPNPDRKENEIEIAPDSKANGEDDAVKFSLGVVDALKEKVKNFNSSSSKRTNITQLKRVFCLAVEDYPFIDSTECSKIEWAIARVNMYLRMLSGNLQRLSDSLSDNQKISFNEFVEISANWTPSEEDFLDAKSIIEKHSLHFKFDTIEELYLNYQPIKLNY
tara:strand:+ start:1463 stop:1972 length:510 start_codon:yes stop_codon:yes gene_type:complete